MLDALADADNMEAAPSSANPGVTHHPEQLLFDRSLSTKNMLFWCDLGFFTRVWLIRCSRSNEIGKFDLEKELAIYEISYLQTPIKNNSNKRLLGIRSTLKSFDILVWPLKMELVEE